MLCTPLSTLGHNSCISPMLSCLEILEINDQKESIWEIKALCKKHDSNYVSISHNTLHTWRGFKLCSLFICFAFPLPVWLWYPVLPGMAAAAVTSWLGTEQAVWVKEHQWSPTRWYFSFPTSLSGYPAPSHEGNSPTHLHKARKTGT